MKKLISRLYYALMTIASKRMQTSHLPRVGDTVYMAGFSSDAYNPTVLEQCELGKIVEIRTSKKDGTGDEHVLVKLKN